MKRFTASSLRGVKRRSNLEFRDCFASLAMTTIVLLGAGCASPPVVTGPASSTSQQATTEATVVLPLDGNIAGYTPSYKRFGEFFRDRFTGYHVGEDSEVAPEDLGPGETQEVPVHAIADGVVRVARRASGYGGVVIISHDVSDGPVNALYGHLAPASFQFKQGETVKKGDVIGVLGKGFTSETDGERQHLHFALYRGEDVKLHGYEQDAARVADWINPQDFFADHGVAVPYDQQDRLYSTLTMPTAAQDFKLDFVVPAGWDVEYVPIIRSLNLYRVRGAGTARTRSQIFIRFFDSDRFQTLSTVDVLSTTERTVGQGQYTARQYLIEKKSTAADFPEQPWWRNTKHLVTDFRARDSYTRYYVVAANPDLVSDVYERVLASMRILP